MFWFTTHLKVRWFFICHINVIHLAEVNKYCWWLVELPMWLTDGFSVTFFGRWRGAVCIHMSHVQLTCGKLLYGGGEPSCVAHMCHMWQLMCTLLLYGGGEPSHVAINVHVTTIWWRGALMCGSRVSHVAHVAINVHVTTIWWRGALMCVTCGN